MAILLNSSPKPLNIDSTVLKRGKIHQSLIFLRRKNQLIIYKFWVSLIAKTMKVTAATAKSLQSCPTLCDPIDGSPPGSGVPGILQARTLEWVAIAFSHYNNNPPQIRWLNVAECIPGLYTRILMYGVTE